MEDIRRADTGQLAVSEEDGRFLRLMVASSGAKRSRSGPPAVQRDLDRLGLRETGGKLTTIEHDAPRARARRISNAQASRIS